MASHLPKVLGAILGGFVFPDEVHQSLEPYGGAVGLRSLLSWEWMSHNMRSALLPLLSTAVPNTIIANVFGRSDYYDSTHGLLLLSRAWLFLLSILLIEPLLLSICRAHRIAHRPVLRLMRTSWVASIILVRPFSNSYEAIALVLLLWLHAKLVQPSHLRLWTLLAYAACVGTVLACGVFIRFTFLAFAAPLIIDLARKRRALTFSAVIGSTALTSVSIAILDSLFYGTASLVPYATDSGAIDTGSNQLYGVAALSFDAALRPLLMMVNLALKQLFGLQLRGSLTWTPLSSVAYNSQIENLAEHGLHPRWTHALVNFPLMFGPATLLAFYAIGRMAVRRVRSVITLTSLSLTPVVHYDKAGSEIEAVAKFSSSDNNGSVGFAEGLRQRRKALIVEAKPVNSAHNYGSSDRAPLVRQNCESNDFLVLCGWIVVCGLCVLSLAPHQEPRFLTPLLFPVAVLAGSTLFLYDNSDAGAITSEKRKESPPRRLIAVGGALRVAWYAFNLAAGCFFGALHQAGVLPSVSVIGRALHRAAELHSSSASPSAASARACGPITNGRTAITASTLLAPWMSQHAVVDALACAILSDRLGSASVGNDDSIDVTVIYSHTYMPPVSPMGLSPATTSGGHSSPVVSADAAQSASRDCDRDGEGISFRLLGVQFPAPWKRRGCSNTAAAAMDERYGIDERKGLTSGVIFQRASISKSDYNRKSITGNGNRVNVTLLDLGILPRDEAEDLLADVGARMSAQPRSRVLLVAPTTVARSALRRVQRGLNITSTLQLAASSDSARQQQTRIRKLVSFAPHLSMEHPPWEAGSDGEAAPEDSARAFSVLGRLQLEIWRLA